MPDVLIRDVPERVLDALKARAERVGWTLDEELLAALVRGIDWRSQGFAERARRIREELAQRRQDWSDSTALIREDRER